MTAIQTHILTGFDDPRLGEDEWMRLLATGDTNVLSLTWHWCRSWWETSRWEPTGSATLLLVAAERGGRIFAVAPLFALEGMIFFVGAGISDYLDFIGDIESADTLCAMLAAAREHAPDFCGFRLHHVPERSRTASFLHTAAPMLGLECHFENDIAGVEIELSQQREGVIEAIGGRMRKREDKLSQSGTLIVRQERELDAIRGLLERFYALHVSRWESREKPSQFAQPWQRVFLERFLESVAELGWNRFLWLEWNGEFLAATVDWYYGGAHFSGPWCFSLDYAKFSPGQVLLRRMVMAALDAGLDRLDLGTGDQAYKLRLPAKVTMCETWGLYPK